MIWYLPSPDLFLQWTFKAPTGNASQTLSWQAWHKPDGINFVKFMIFGPGGGGGGGFAAAAATQRGGGGGGGSGAVTFVVFEARLIPKTIWIWVGVAGGGGASGVGGGGGTGSFVSLVPNDSTAQAVLAFAQPGGGGQTGSATVGGTGGSAGPATVIGTCPMIQRGIWQSLIGDVGGAGGVSAAGTSKTLLGNATVMCGGSGGAGTTSGNVNAAGGDIVVSGAFRNKVAGGIAGGGRGSDGYWLEEPFMSFPGAGGGSNGASGVGGAGGNGVYGQGGGGGGAGVTGGAGGRGGDGLIIIQCS